MQIRNCLIITTDDSLMQMSIDELKGSFSGNVIYSQTKVPQELLDRLSEHTAFSFDADATAPEGLDRHARRSPEVTRGGRMEYNQLTG